ncbi:MAG: DUF3592 domain-containing protein [Pseudomonadota bacterium]
MGGSIFLTLFFGLFLAVGVGILGWGLYSLNMARQAESWPTVQGEVTHSDFVVSSDSDGTTYRTKITYAYSILGRELTSERIAFGYSGSSSQQFHRDIYSALPVGAQVAVRHDPSNPERAALSFGVNQSIKFLLIFGAVWTMFTLGMLAMVWMSGQGATTLLDNMIVYSR